MSILDYVAHSDAAPPPFAGGRSPFADTIAEAWGKPAKARVDNNGLEESAATQTGTDSQNTVTETADRLVASLGENGNFSQFESEIQDLVKGVKLPDLDRLLAQLQSDLSKKLLESGVAWRIDKIQYDGALDQFELSVVNTHCDGKGTILISRVAHPKYINPDADCFSDGSMKMTRKK